MTEPLKPLAERIADYVETNISYDNLSKREVMLEALRIAFTEAAYDTAQEIEHVVSDRTNRT